MSGFQFDTNVVSELRKADRCNGAVRAWAVAQNPGDAFLSVVVLAEIRFGIPCATDPDFRAPLESWLADEVRLWFSGRVLAVDEEVFVRWRELLAKGRMMGHTFSQPDLFLAAQADLHNLTVATRNVSDFEKAGVSVVNPWEFKATSG